MTGKTGGRAPRRTMCITRIGRRLTVAAAIAAGLGAAGARAETSYGCSGLLDSDLIPAIEDTAGGFYRVDPDMKMYHWIDEVRIDGLKRLSDTLARHGTTLVYVPVPTRALAMPNALPQVADHLGYDEGVAASVYDEMLDRLRDAGVRTVDGASALRRAANAGRDPVFATDPRLTPEGNDALAEAVAGEIREAPGYEALPKSGFRPREVGQRELPSLNRVKLQHHCATELPRVVATVYDSVREAQVTGVSESMLPGSGSAPQGIVVVGTEITGEPVTNFAGFLSAHAQLTAQTYFVRGGGAYDAISSYLTSANFRSARPAVLVWANPVWNGLGTHADQPMRELIAAAGNSCTLDLPLNQGLSSTLRASLGGLDPRKTYTLELDAGGTPAQRASFDFISTTGQSRTRTIHRHEGAALTGRFYMPLSGLWPEGIEAVEIEMDTQPGARPVLRACVEED